MKKLVMTVAVLACAVSFVSAQVTSVNIVGYNKATTASGLVMQGTQFINPNSTPEGLFADILPVGSKIYTFDGGVYQIAEFKSGFGGVTFWDVSLDLGQSSGYFVETDGIYEPIISGDVELADTFTNNIVAGLQMLSYPYPTSTTVETLGFSPTVGDKIYTFVGGVYQIAEFKSGFGGVTFWDVNLPISVGQGFWYESKVVTTWVATRPFTP